MTHENTQYRPDTLWRSTPVDRASAEGWRTEISASLCHQRALTQHTNHPCSVDCNHLTKCHQLVWLANEWLKKSAELRKRLEDKQKLNQEEYASIPVLIKCSGVGKCFHIRSPRIRSLTSFSWGKGGNVTSAGWQVTPRDSTWHVNSRSGETSC